LATADDAARANLAGSTAHAANGARIGLPASAMSPGPSTLPTNDVYASGNVTDRGTEVGRVEDVRVTDTGVEAVLSLKSDVPIPSDLEAQVHSQTAIGEQYVALLPRNDTSAPLRNGDVISRDRASVPPNINSLLDATNKGLQAIPNDNVKTVIDESYTALGGRGPEFTRFINGATTLAIDANRHIDDLSTLVDQRAPMLDSPTDTSDAIQSWAANLANVTQQSRT
jgi:phospholipid/cholesterol/gamma-HCH transport system substrate-binding protein